MKKLLFAAIAALGISNLHAQGNLGYHTDNYSGVHALNFNPAEIVDSRYRFHMNIFSLDLTASNNYLGVKGSALFADRDTAFADPEFNRNWVVERLNGRNKSVYQNLNLSVLPSFMFTFGKKTQHAVGFNMRVRTTVNANGIDERTARQSWWEQELTDLYNVDIQNKNLSIQAAVWADYGVTYGRDIINTGTHYLKAAGTVKLTQGLASAYFYSNNADIRFTSDSTLSIRDTDINFGYSEALSTLPRNSADATDKNRYGMGFDFGAVYEFRPKHDKYKYEMDGDAEHYNPTKNKYMLKAGFAVTDLGYMRFDRSRGQEANFYANVNNIVLENYFSTSFEDFDTTGLSGFADTLTSLFDVSTTKNKKYNVALPTRINIYVDYNIWKGFYANFTASVAPGYVRNAEKTRALSEFSITPRYENSWFAFFLPVSMNSHGNFHVGTGLRLGPLVIGTNDITPLLGKKTIYDMNFYTALSVPINRRLKDKDRDHVSNKNDLCKKDKGTWATKGCPDKDGDGIDDAADKCPDDAGLAEFGGCPDRDGDKVIDKDDKCPDDAGLVEFGGCPDRDGDKIIDSEDKCPDDAGLVEFGGCPDRDGDKIIDSEDKCPDAAGLVEFGGCPDRDGDKIIDSEDQCPDEAGLAEFGGCPDKDGDGTPDKNDDCVDLAGPKENKGCPWPDTDGDGILDKDDNCPKVPGIAALKGCPEIKEEVKKIIKQAFDNLQFETGKSVILKTSYASLDKLAQVLKDDQTFKLTISGHTDNVGIESENLKLSKARAEAVKAYFVKKGIDEKRISADGFGSTKPVADNKTKEGRAKNRRVEMLISNE
jgi:outer membrane protein OmpA-like peptidoglycan-associated protein